MLVEGRKKRVFRLKDLNSLISFEDWLKRNLSLYSEDESVPSSHIISFLEYINQQIKEQKLADKREWQEQVEALLVRAGKENEH